MEYGSLEVREIGRFLRTRRESANPSAFNRLPQRRRHVPHLTQAELAELAGVSSVVVSQIEQARYPNLNAPLLQRIAGALDLPKDHQAYMVGLLNKGGTLTPRTEVPDWVRSTTNDTAHPVTVVNACFDILAWNEPTTKILGDFSLAAPEERNVVFAMFCSPHLESMMVDIETYRANVVSVVKMRYSLAPAYRGRILRLAREIEKRSNAFRIAWDTADPFNRPNMNKHLNHPDLGVLNLYEVVGDIMGEEGLGKIEFLPADDATRQKMRAL